MKIVEVITTPTMFVYFRTYSRLKRGDLVSLSNKTGNAVKYKTRTFIGMVNRLLSKEEYDRLIKLRRKVR